MSEEQASTVGSRTPAKVADRAGAREGGALAGTNFRRRPSGADCVQQGLCTGGTQRSPELPTAALCCSLLAALPLLCFPSLLCATPSARSGNTTRRDHGTNESEVLQVDANVRKLGSGSTCSSPLPTVSASRGCCNTTEIPCSKAVVVHKFAPELTETWTCSCDPKLAGNGLCYAAELQQLIVHVQRPRMVRLCFCCACAFVQSCGEMGRAKSVAERGRGGGGSAWRGGHHGWAGGRGGGWGGGGKKPTHAGGGGEDWGGTLSGATRHGAQRIAAVSGSRALMQDQGLVARIRTTLGASRATLADGFATLADGFRTRGRSPWMVRAAASLPHCEDARGPKPAGPTAAQPIRTSTRLRRRK